MLRFLIAVTLAAGNFSCSPEQFHVFEVVEESFTEANTYDNPNLEVEYSWGVLHYNRY